jgi:hypothetical protein
MRESNSLTCFLGFVKSRGFSMTVLKDSVRGLRYKIGIFIWELAHMEK